MPLVNPDYVQTTYFFSFVPLSPDLLMQMLLDSEFHTLLASICTLIKYLHIQLQIYYCLVQW